MSIGKLTRVALREVWKHEARDFTTWLQDNIEILNEVLDLTLVSAEREQAAGDFNVDLVGEDEYGNTVVIENQLEKSNHDHLGKVLTYVTALEAKAAVWIVSRPRAEHVKAMSWLNEATSTPFYLIQVEAVRIGESPPAPLFTRIVGPSVEARAAGAVRKDQSEKRRLRLLFWTELLEVAKAKSKLHARVSPGSGHHITTGSGVNGLRYSYLVRKHGTQVHLYIDRGDASENTAVFDQIIANKASIEAEYGGAIEWCRMDDSRACRIAQCIERGGWADEGQWSGAIEDTVNAMGRLERALREPLKALKAAGVV